MPLYLHPPLLFLSHLLTRNSSPLASFTFRPPWTPFGSNPFLLWLSTSAFVYYYIHTATMSLASGVSITDECLNKFNDLRMGKKFKFIIFKIADNKKEVVVEEASAEPDYEVFRTKLDEARDAKGNPVPRYAAYDVEYDLGGGEGKRSKIVFISWVPSDASTLWSMIYASTRENLKNALNIPTSIHADDKSDIEWKTILVEASGGKAGK